jgi:hypothetical protein
VDVDVHTRGLLRQSPTRLQTNGFGAVSVLPMSCVHRSAVEAQKISGHAIGNAKSTSPTTGCSKGQRVRDATAAANLCRIFSRPVLALLLPQPDAWPAFFARKSDVDGIGPRPISSRRCAGPVRECCHTQEITWSGWLAEMSLYLQPQHRDRFKC